MRKVPVFIVCLLLLKSGFSQITSDSLFADRDLVKTYSKIAFMPGIDGKAVIRKWNTDMKIFIESNKTEYYRKQVNSIIQKINPCLNTIKISLVDSKGNANCVIKIDSLSRTHYQLHWDDTGHIYKSMIYINSDNVFNNVEQLDYISEYLMKVLGDFHFPVKINPSVALRLHLDPDVIEKAANDTTQSILKSRINGFTEFDFKVMKLHYSKDVKAGIDKKGFNEIVKKKLSTDGIIGG